MRRPGTAIRPERDGHLGNFEGLEHGCLDDHLGCKFHARGFQLHFFVSRFGESPQAAMKIPDGAFEKESPDEREDGIADPTVLPRHRSRRNRAATVRKPAAHYEIKAVAEFLNKPVDVGKVIAVIGITHDDPFGLGRLNAAAQGAAISFFPDRHDPGAGFLRDRRRTVGAAVVRHKDFARHPGGLEPPLRLGDADGKRFGLVQAGNHNGQFDGF